MSRYAFAILIALLLASCGSDVVYQQQQAFGPGGWRYADSVDFAFPVTDTAGSYDLVLTVDHGQQFANQNFYVHLNTHLPDGTVLSQPLSLELADKFGEWYGDCNSGGCVTNISIQEGTRFTQTGDHRLVVSQFSRQDPLPEITALGFRIVKR
ncbi:gliding motility-associated lipoprotein GldH [Neolewinella xylanilytica]|uniref:Gliding motility-associated lipoprotein GldH n=1 Tax=Neolewinella xylanilytica TaxID=1514080 RepID=A0A2S6IB37_9BACT|nr:gliding motility lipoprotein GldH [Neolewinella xylanilytica]PPK88720.1 gliding motility-associated lipoprotein GldH [Neolewinella xylanilytica]